MGTTAPTYTAEQLELRLALRYRGDDAEILFGVRNDAGFRADRTADAIAIGLWPSTGCYLQGFEIKVARSDWLRELKDGAKSEAFMPYMDFWWLVAPREVVKDEELPPGWGLLVPVGEDKLRVARQATRNESPKPMPRGMLAALVKRASTRKALKEELAASYREGVKDGRAQASRSQNWDVERARGLREQVERFAKETGIQVEGFWEHAALRQAYALVKSGGHLDLSKRLGYAATNVERLAQELRATATEIEGAAAAPIAAPPAEAPRG